MTEAVPQQRSWYKRPLVWVLVAIILGLGAFGIRQVLNGPPRIAYGEFFNQLADNNVANVTLSGTQINGTLKHPLSQGPANGSAAPNTFHSQVPELGDPALLPELRKDHVPIAVTSSSAYWWGTSAVLGGLLAILLAKPMILIIAAAFIAGLVRVARGGKMDMRSTLAVVPMFKSFADQKKTDGKASAQLNRGIPAEDEMTHVPKNLSKRAWYFSPAAWIAAILVASLAIFGVVEMNNGPATISYSDFFNQLDAGNVGSVTIAATQIDGKFKQAVEVTAANKTEPQTAFRSQAPSFGDPSLLPELRQQHVVIDVVSSSSWLSWLGRLPWPMVLIIVGLLIAGVVKLVRGDKATSGSALSLHPMTGMIASLFGGPAQSSGSTINSHEAPPKT
jgi:ATP-dependent Zn protease